MEEKRKFNWMSLIIGVVFIFTSIVAFKNPVTTMASVVVYFGASGIIKGLVGLMSSKKLKEITNISTTPFIIINIIDIIIGIIILLNIEWGVITLPYMFALWFIMDAISDLAFGRKLKYISKPMYWLNIVTSIITFILGVMMLFNPLSSYLTVIVIIGMYFLINGIRYIINAFNG